MRYILISVVFMVSICAIAQSELERIDLPTPDVTGGNPLMEVLASRQSTREFNSEVDLSEQTISNLLWAGFGVNRHDTGQRTAPSALGTNVVDVYLATAEGLFLFDAEAHCLFKLNSEDIREFTGNQEFTQTAPVNLIYVAKYDRIPEQFVEHQEFYAAADVGYISQNIYLFCSSEGLATVVLAWIDYQLLAEKINLPENSQILLTQPVGYPVQ